MTDSIKTNNMNFSVDIYEKTIIINRDVKTEELARFIRQHNFTGYTVKIIKPNLPAWIYEPAGSEYEKKYPSIDKVTVDNLDVALRICGYSLDRSLIDLIIDLVEIIEINGDNTSMKDVVSVDMQQEEC